MISHTKLRSAIEGWKLPSKKRPFPLSHTDSIFIREAERSFSPSAAASGFKGNPSAGARAELSTYAAESWNGRIFIFQEAKNHSTYRLRWYCYIPYLLW